ncbi:MAG: hypothetical protein QME06_09925 [Desulfobacterales bacterium]|nr:hypothetical protein [Desulfobacterales bacterium]
MNDEISPNQGVEMAQPLEEEEIIELTDEVIDDDLATSIGGDNTFEKEISDDNMHNKFADLLGVDLEPEIDTLEDTQEDVPLSYERLEETLERVVEKMFSEKIEKLLAEMIEAAVSREIKSIKEKLRNL